MFHCILVIQRTYADSDLARFAEFQNAELRLRIQRRFFRKLHRGFSGEAEGCSIGAEGCPWGLQRVFYIGTGALFIGAWGFQGRCPFHCGKEFSTGIHKILHRIKCLSIDFEGFLTMLQ